MTAFAYDHAFYERTAKSERAARAIVPIIQTFAKIDSVLDVGCARGLWLAAWAAAGCADYMGLDGAYVERDKLAIGADRFAVTDLARPFDLGRRFDYVQCLEVAEHLPETRSRGLVADLTRHADIVLFAAAPRGQGGEFHINEQDYEYWRALFAAHDYVPFDCLRPRLAGWKEIPFWYRYNTILYVKAEAVDSLSAEAARWRVDAAQSITDVAPVLFRLRRMVLRCLPQAAINGIARFVARLG